MGLETALGMRCEIFWASDNDFYKGKILDFRRNMTCIYDDGEESSSPEKKPKGMKERDWHLKRKETANNAKKVFFILYDDNDKEWIELIDYKLLNTSADEPGQKVIKVTKSKKVREYWDESKQRFIEGDKYEPTEMKVRRAEIVKEEAAFREKKKQLTAGQGSKPNPAGEQKQKRKPAPSAESQPPKKVQKKEITLSQKGLPISLVEKAKAKVAEQSKRDAHNAARSLKPPGKRNSGPISLLSEDKIKVEEGKRDSQQLGALRVGLQYKPQLDKVASSESDLYEQLGVSHSWSDSILFKAFTKLSSGKGSSGEAFRLQRTLQNFHQEVAVLLDMFSPSAEKQALSKPLATKATSLGAGTSSVSQTVQKTRESVKHDELIKNSFFKKQYDMLVKAFDSRDTAEQHLLSKNNWMDWKNYRKIFEKSDEDWHRIESRLKQSFARM